MEIKLKHILAVRVAEWIKKVDLAKWKKEWSEMGESQQERYDYILLNYDGFFKKKAN